MTTTPAAIWGPIALGVAASSLVAVSGAGAKMTVTRAVFTNTDSVARSITVNVVRSGSGVAASNRMISAFSIAPGASYTAPELAGLVLATGDSVWALASAAGLVNALASGYTS